MLKTAPKPHKPLVEKEVTVTEVRSYGDSLLNPQTAPQAFASIDRTLAAVCNAGRGHAILFGEAQGMLRYFRLSTARGHPMGVPL